MYILHDCIPGFEVWLICNKFDYGYGVLQKLVYNDLRLEGLSIERTVECQNSEIFPLRLIHVHEEVVHGYGVKLKGLYVVLHPQIYHTVDIIALNFLCECVYKNSLSSIHFNVW